MSNQHSPELLTWLFENIVPPGRDKDEFLRSVQHEMTAGLPQRITPEVHVIGRRNDWDVRVAVWRCPGGIRNPTVIHYHGGGWQVGNHLSHEGVCTALALQGFNVVSVDYRRAPRDHFPAAFDDALLVHEWLLTRGDDLGLDPARIGLSGDSSGGNLAAAVAAHVGPEGVGAVVAIYGIFDYHRCVPVFERVGMAVDYLDAEEFEHWRGDPRLSPEVVADRLPPTLLVEAEHDWLTEESDYLAAALAKTGRPARRHREPGVGHGFLQAPLLPEFDRTMRVIGEFLHEHLDSRDEVAS